MLIEKKVSLQKQTNAGTMSITIPKQFVDIFNLKQGDTITVILDTEKDRTLQLKF